LPIGLEHLRFSRLSLAASADILLYRSQYVPVGEDQVAHVEITREVARASIISTAAKPEFEQKVEKAIKSLGSRNSRCTARCARSFQEKGDAALERARALVEATRALTVADRDRLFGFLEGTGISILPEPEVLLTATPKVPGLDGRKMSKSYGNTIGLREDHRFGRQETQGHADRSGARAAHRSGRSR
jgi:tryptophanyl-tRNA synthetase